MRKEEQIGIDGDGNKFSIGDTVAVKCYASVRSGVVERFTKEGCFVITNKNEWSLYKRASSYEKNILLIKRKDE